MSLRTPRCLTIATTLAAALSVSGCGASLPSASTGSLFGGSSAPPTPAPPTNDPTSRAVQVGSTAARAQKCGFNFDPVKLRTQFITAEGAALANPADAGKLGQVYDTAYRGVGKAVAGQNEAYCSGPKTTKIKTALTRHLAGDYTPEPPEPIEEEPSLFGGESSSSYGPPSASPGFEH